MKRPFIAMLIVCVSISSAFSIDTKSYYADEDKSSTLVSAAQLYKWVKNGNKTEDGKRVIIVDVVPTKAQQGAFFEGNVKTLKKLGFSWAPLADKAGYLGHIPGAISIGSHTDPAKHYSTRNDGPMDVIHQLGDEKTVNKFLQARGITLDSVVVFTTSDFTRLPYCPSRAFWTLRYWGMSKNNVKILDGNNVGWAQYIAENHPDKVKTMGLQKGKQTVKVVKSNLKVTDFPKKFTEIRATIGEIIKAVDKGELTNEIKYVIDVRQTSSFFITDIDANKKLIEGKKIKAGAGKFGMPKFDKNQFSPVVFQDSVVDAWKNDKGLIPVTLSSKAEAFEAQIKGAVLSKGKNKKGELYNITAGTFFNTTVLKKSNGKPALIIFTTQKKPTDIATKAKWVGDKKITVEQMFARIFPDKNKEIIVNCSSGSPASATYFYLSQVLGYKNVKDYDGSLIEWGNLAAFEPNDANIRAGLKVVRPDFYTWNPKSVNMPAVTIFATGYAHPFHIDKKGDKYIVVDEVTGKTCVVDEPNCSVKTGGPLKGNMKWDTVSRSQHILFRPTVTINDGIRGKKDVISKKQEYNKKVDWAKVKAHPEYSGNAVKTIEIDGAYE